MNNTHTFSRHKTFNVFCSVFLSCRKLFLITYYIFTSHWSKYCGLNKIKIEIKLCKIKSNFTIMLRSDRVSKPPQVKLFQLYFSHIYRRILFFVVYMVWTRAVVASGVV